ncbi:MAG: SpoIIE family protein phosphatase [Pseudomonadota bacterium]
MGHDAITAKDGVEALDLFDQQRPELVMLDVEMPNMDGYVAARQIRARCTKMESWIPIIFISERSGDQDIDQGIAAGGDDFLCKPIRPAVLKAKLDAMQRCTHRINQLLANKTLILEQQQKRLKKEEFIAKGVFDHITRLRQVEESCLRSIQWPMNTFSGDLIFYARRPSGTLNVLFADFTGHGLGAALGALPVADALYSMTAKDFAIETIIDEINTKLVMLLPVSRFCAAVAMEIDTQNRTLKIWNGGLPDALVVNSEGRVRQRITSNHPPIGITKQGDDYSQCEIITLLPTDRLFAYSDGLTEANNSQGEMFGQQRLEAHFSDHKDPGQWLKGLQQSLVAFRGEADQTDDISIIEIIL